MSVDTITKLDATDEERAAMAAAEAAAAAIKAACAQALAKRQKEQDALDEDELRQVLPPAGVVGYVLTYTHVDPTCYLRHLGEQVFCTDGVCVWRDLDGVLALGAANKVPLREFAMTRDLEAYYSYPAVRGTTDRPDAVLVLRNLACALARKRQVRAVLDQCAVGDELSVLVSQYDTVLDVVRVTVRHCVDIYVHREVRHGN